MGTQTGFEMGRCINKSQWVLVIMYPWSFLSSVFKSSFYGLLSDHSPFLRSLQPEHLGLQLALIHLFKPCVDCVVNCYMHDRVYLCSVIMYIKKHASELCTDFA